MDDLEKGPTAGEGYGRWAGRVDVCASDLFDRLQAGLTIETIATPRNMLRTCESGEPVADVLEGNVEGFDYLPVTGPGERGGDRILGLLNAAACAAKRQTEGVVLDHFETLSEQSLIGADASILSFIVDAEKSPCRLVVSGPRIVGLVGLSDLQKLPVRAALFGLITGLEMTMTDAIRRASAERKWVQCLNAERQRLLNIKVAASKDSDGFVDSLLLTEFCDKVTIVLQTLKLVQSKRGAERTLKGIQELRDNLAHANDYAASPKAAANVCTAVRELLRLQPQIATAPSKSQS